MSKRRFRNIWQILSIASKSWLLDNLVQCIAYMIQSNCNCNWTIKNKIIGNCICFYCNYIQIALQVHHIMQLLRVNLICNIHSSFASQVIYVSNLLNKWFHNFKCRVRDCHSVASHFRTPSGGGESPAWPLTTQTPCIQTKRSSAKRTL